MKQDEEGDSTADICAGSTSGVFDLPSTNTASPILSASPSTNPATIMASSSDTTTTTSTNFNNVSAPNATRNSHFQAQQQQQQQQQQAPDSTGAYYQEPQNYYMNEFNFASEMGPVADMSTFPPTMAAPPNPTGDGSMMMGMTMENILSSGFWDSMLVPGMFYSRQPCTVGVLVFYSDVGFVGYNSMDGLSGGFVFGAGGSGLITPRFGFSPMQSGTNTPSRGHGQHSLTQSTINAAFTTHGQLKDGIKMDS
jgi:hypothetical protein